MPGKAGEVDTEMTEASVLAEASGATIEENERTKTTEGAARTRGRPKKAVTVSQPVISFTAGSLGASTRKRRSIEALNENQAKPDIAEQIAQLKELILMLMQRQQEYQENKEKNQNALYENREKRLNESIKNQTDKTEELIQQQKELQKENKALQKENQDLRAMNIGNSVRRPTFADVARRGSEDSTQTKTNTSARTSSDEGQTRIRMQDDPRTITINTFRVEGEKEDFNVVREKLQRSINKFRVLERVQIECLRPLPGDRINVVFRTEAEARTAREHKQWVTTAMPTARVKGETWYPIKCDIVSKEAVGDVGEDNKITLKPEVCTRFKDDNSEDGLDFTAHQARWLSKPNPNKRTGSLVIWLRNKLSAEHLLRKGQVLFGAYGAFCSQYHSASDDGPCYNCNSYGHKQSHCKKQAKCGICSEKHQTRDSTNRNKPKCPACTGPHPIFDRRCIRHPRHIERGARGEESSRPRTNPEPYPWSTVRSSRANANRINVVEWIFSFCTQRSANLVIDNYRFKVEEITHAGIPQGSPLSSILYIFYNANLVEGPIDRTQGSLGFVDEFTAWVVRKDQNEATRALQYSVIPKAESWARESGATFEAEKTGFIHFPPPGWSVRKEAREVRNTDEK